MKTTHIDDVDKIICIGDQIIDGVYKLHSKFTHVLNFVCNDILLAIVDSSVGAGPINIVVSNVLEFADCSVVKITQTKIYIEDSHEFLRCEIPIYVSSYHAISDFPRMQLRKNMDILKTFLLQNTHPNDLTFLIDVGDNQHNYQNKVCSTLTFSEALTKRIFYGCSKIKAGNIVEGVSFLKGCGYGLTPSGDDFNAGLLVGLILFKKLGVGFLDEIYKTAIGNNIFSNNFLYLARNGFLTEKVKNFVSSLFSDSGDKMQRCAKKVMELGETSGSDFLVGFVFAFEQL